VYAAKSTDVRHVMVNGQLLMDDRQLLTLDEAALKEKAVAMAKEIDAFLISREGNLMSKLLAVGSGVEPVETFEVQAKAKIADAADFAEKMQQANITITRSSVRNQYDSYFIFKRAEMGRIRYREDEILNEDGSVKEVLYRIGLIGHAAERVFDNSIILSRSRYSLPADKSLRFYREYFQPDKEIRVEKHRQRFHVVFKNTQLVINIDTLKKSGNMYVEAKSRTWSAKDAEEKAALLSEFLETLGIPPNTEQVRKEYVDLV